MLEEDDNCSALTFGRPPNVSQNLEALGHYGLTALSLGGLTTLTLVILFVVNVVGFIRYSPPRRWRLLAWVTSMTMVISFLALMTLLIPRAGNFCDSIKQIFIPFIMMHFVGLTLDFEGGHKAALDDLLTSNTAMTTCAPPCCCLGLCLKDVVYTKKKLRLIKALVYQMPLVQLAVLMAVALLTEAEVIIRGNGPDGLFIFLHVINILCFMTAMYALNIITKSFAPHLTSINYRFKSALVTVGIILLKLQNFILVILAVTGVIPCILPSTSRLVVQRSIDASLTLAESFILGILTFVDYRKLDRNGSSNNTFMKNQQHQMSVTGADDDTDQLDGHSASKRQHATVHL